MQAVPSRADPSRAPCAAKGALRSGSRVWLAALLLALLTVLAARPARAEDETVVAGMSQNRIAITADFDGSELLIFGAVKRETPIPDDGALGVIVTISGPLRPVTVRRKARRLGIWVNTDFVDVDLAPSFYAVATSSPWNDIISDTEDLRYKISIPRAIRSVGAPQTVHDSPVFTDALIRIRTAAGLYQLLEGQVTLSQETLFDTSVRLPADLTEGTYRTRILLTRNRRVIDTFETEIDVGKVGLERALFTLAHDQPFVYGILSLVMAITAGWGASAAFRYFRR